MIEHDYFLPFPEIVDPRARRPTGSATRAAWTRRASVDKLHRRLWVPLRPDGGPVVRHEFAHILWSPEKFPPFHPAVILQAVEDARINLGLVRVGLPVDLDAEQRAHVGAARAPRPEELVAVRTSCCALRGVARHECRGTTSPSWRRSRPTTR
jgi:hypothetical protein